MPLVDLVRGKLSRAIGWPLERSGCRSVRGNGRSMVSPWPFVQRRLSDKGESATLATWRPKQSRAISDRTSSMPGRSPSRTLQRPAPYLGDHFGAMQVLRAGVIAQVH